MGNESGGAATPAAGSLSTYRDKRHVLMEVGNSRVRLLDLSSKVPINEKLYVFPVPSAAERTYHWLNALRFEDSIFRGHHRPRRHNPRIENSEINQLHIKLADFSREECLAFFGALAENESLKMIVMESISRDVDAEWLCGTLRDYGLTDRVVIQNYLLDEVSIKVLPQCPEISNVILAPSFFKPHGEEEPETFSSLFDALGRCEHVTSVRVRCENLCGKRFDRTAMSCLAAYIRGARSLKKVEVDLSLSCHFAGDKFASFDKQLARALASNTTLASVSIVHVNLKVGDVNRLVNYARRNRHLTNFEVTEHDSTWYPRKCACCCSCRKLRRPVLPPMWDHVEVYVPRSRHYQEAPEWRQISLVHSARRRSFARLQEYVKRNASVVRAAVGFVLGHRGARVGQRAIELLQDHPDVLEIVRECAGVEMPEARNMIADAVSRLRHCSLNDFMRQTGVVREKIECFRDQPGGALRLTDINHQCWLRIRSFLKIADVVGVLDDL
ncbi:hypothetical protein HPB50_013577 [Hyalomma asiaticum]|uniref:Uncharacterized protein n=1 Tax=Hyalomma asiaticum TaxID=266040 RepID=A0ACB7RX70_HYAAI|nr:hypothetical protein HPB50_013577 [Hyalomma asiaticum]